MEKNVAKLVRIILWAFSFLVCTNYGQIQKKWTSVLGMDRNPTFPTFYGK
jgi:hypothetical protein